MILVTGAGGKTGRTLVKALSNTGSIGAFVHREEQVAGLKALGAKKVVAGDMHDETALQTALQGVRAIYHICPNMDPDEVGIGKLTIDLARENGVEHFVYHSVLHAQIEKMPHHWAKLRVEEMLFESGLPFTILQPAPYMQNLLVGWKNILEDGVLRIPYSVNSKFSFVDLEDVAAAAKVVFTEPNHINTTYELVGTPPLSHVEVAQVFSRVFGREVRAEEETIGDWRLRAERSSAGAQSKRTGLSKYAVENLIKMFEYYDQLGLAGNPNVLRWILKHEPTSLELFIERSMADG